MTSATNNSAKNLKRLIVSLCGTGIVFLGNAASAPAANLNAYGEFNFGSSDVTFTSPAGVVTSSHSQSFQQRYDLSLSSQLYPLLFLSAGGVFQNAQQQSSFNGFDSSGSATSISPFVALNLQSPFMPSSLGYHRREDTSSSNGVSAPASILESYDGHVDFHPLDLPPLSLTYSHSHSYEETKKSRDSETDSLVWSTNYHPGGKGELSYQGTLSESTNNLSELQSQILTNTGRAGYSGNLLNNRVVYATSYSLSSVTSSVSKGGGGGEVFLPVTPLNGALFGTTSPTQVPLATVTSTPGGLPANPALLGNANIPLVVTTIPAGQQLNLGFNFGRAVSVNTFYMRTVSGGNTRPENVAKIADRFHWEIYTSDDGVTWTLIQTIPATQFGTDPTGRTDTVGFILNFTMPAPRQYVKAVVTPVLANDLLSAGVIQNVNLNDISVAQMQAFNRQNADTFVGGATSSLAGQYNFSTSVRLFDSPSVGYDMSFGLSHSSGTDQDLHMTYSLTDSLAASHVFSPIVAGSARVSLQNGLATGQKLTSDLSYSAGVSLTPLPALSHSISYSGSITKLGESDSITGNSIFVSNSAQLYAGVSAGLSGGYSTSSSKTGQTSDSTVLAASLSLTPRKDLNLGFSYSNVRSKSSGGGFGTQDSSSQSGGVNASYSPFEAVFLSGSWSIVMQEGLPSTTEQSYGLSWSPLRGGALQLSFSYSSSLILPQNDKSTTISPTLSWKIRPGTTLDFSYQSFTQSSRSSGDSEGSNIAAVLRTAF